MRICVDARQLTKEQKTGKGQWTAGFLTELSSRSHDLTLLGKDVHFSPGLRFHFEVSKYLREIKPDLYISPTSYIVPALVGTKVPCIPIVHDLIAFMHEPHDRKAKLIERLTLHRALAAAQHICTVSDATKMDLLDRYSALDHTSITTIYAGPMQRSVAPNRPDQKTILCIGTLCPRKNQYRLIQAYAALPEPLRSHYRLVLCGARGWNDSAIVRLAQNTKGVEWKDYVSDEEYSQLLSTATVFAYPSLYEGFGMQVLDALQRGIPVLTSDRGSLKEVAGDSAVYCDPDDETSIMRGLIALLQNDDLCNNLAINGPIQAEKFSWKRTVDLFLNAVE